MQNVNKAQTKIRTKKDNVAGVNLPKFEVVSEGAGTYELTGLSRGGQQITKCRENYKKAIQLLVELASLQTSFVTLDEVIKVFTLGTKCSHVLYISGCFLTSVTEKTKTQAQNSSQKLKEKTQPQGALSSF